MEDYLKIVPPPILLNCWKHHLGFIKSSVKKSVRNPEDAFIFLKNKLLLIGDSQMDLYTGKLSPREISGIILGKLNDWDLLNYEIFRKWISEKKFKLISLEDDSVWTLRLGKFKERFVHIHPGRYSPNTIRVKANTLKTATAVLLMKKIMRKEVLTLEEINYVRILTFSAPPLKSLPKNSALLKMIRLLEV